MDRFTCKIIPIVVFFLFSCSQNQPKESFRIETKFENLEKAKADWPGLYFDFDSLVTIISILNEKGHIVEKVMYEGSTDTFWTSVIERDKEGALKDTLVNSFVAKPIELDESNLTLYFMLFDDAVVKVKRNDVLTFEGNVETYSTTVVLKKEGLEKMQLEIGNESFDLDIRKEYNFIEITDKDSVLQCTYRYYIPI